MEIIPDDEPSGSGQNSESLSIDETNKLRAKLGLKPLEVHTSEKSDKKRDDGKKKDDWGEFYHKPAENWADKAEREKLRAKLATAKEKRQMELKMNRVKTLGDSDSDDNVENWVDKNRKIDLAKKEAEKRAKMLEELDEQFGVSEFVENEKREKRRQQYTEKNLKGLRVEHDIDSFAEERDVVLTLKDKAVLDEDDEDVLVNVNMIDDEKYRKVRTLCLFFVIQYVILLYLNIIILFFLLRTCKIERKGLSTTHMMIKNMINMETPLTNHCFLNTMKL